MSQLSEKECPVCGNTFMGTAKKRYDTTACQQKANYQRNSPKYLEKKKAKYHLDRQSQRAQCLTAASTSQEVCFHTKRLGLPINCSGVGYGRICSHLPGLDGYLRGFTVNERPLKLSPEHQAMCRGWLQFANDQNESMHEPSIYDEIIKRLRGEKAVPELVFSVAKLTSTLAARVYEDIYPGRKEKSAAEKSYMGRMPLYLCALCDLAEEGRVERILDHEGGYLWRRILKRDQRPGATVVIKRPVERVPT